MKSLSLFARLIILFTFWTFAFLGLAAYSATKALTTDPDLEKKIENKFNLHVQGSSLSFNSWSDHRTAESMAKKTWDFTLPKKKMILKSMSGDFAIKEISGTEVHVSAEGNLDPDRATQILMTEITGDELILSEPLDATVEHLQVRIEIPSSYAGDLQISTLSGNITIENTNLKNLNLETTSGEITLNQVTSQSLEIKTVSGDIRAEELRIPQITGSSVSGQLDLGSKIPAQIDLSSVSGDVTLQLSEKENMTFSLDSRSGKISNARANNPKGPFHVHASTTSGNIRIE